ncbi:M12 family metallo-peptidase [Hymenobacter sp. 15J16-1T3B]|uniref:zinc-dependent metalloprotease n=1 Tax=Hymenobacter sp. 15J16-1T3B TaxID=2886941 RepID=UPI001D0FD752|nr:zinc-dependent metalloprotease family protein [Hymenobacter sp. 15J16-1T3B]MCC3158835.1 M12 family metallo-peptidase [Hymenobacter sp. 15J16-1T3B]
MRTSSTPTGTLRSSLLGGLLLLGLASPFAASAQRVLWADSKAERLPAAAHSTTQALDRYRVVSVQTANLRAALAAAPAEQGAGARQSATVVSLPLPDGTAGRFRVVETQVMHPALAAKFPQIKTYAGQGIDDPSAVAYFDVSPAGLHTMILSPGNTVYMDPTADGVNHLVFYKRDINQAVLTRAVCGVNTPTGIGQRLSPTDNPTTASAATIGSHGTQRRLYRLAMACTGEYAATKGGTLAGAMAGITTSVNRVSGVYTTELSVAFQLVANNDQLVFLNANSDPYTNNDGPTMLGENQTTVTNIIGANNYDIGHVFSTGGGGIAGLGVVCVAGNKARGVTGLPNPTGDAFDIDFVAHEMGHQFGGAHTFNSIADGNCTGPIPGVTNGTRSSLAAYEPGSGTTIMAYAGICSPSNIQPHSDPYFHAKSLEQIIAHITGTGNCATLTATNNTPPTVSAGTRRIIPKGTPFELTGTGTDADGDALTYCWEQYDLGPGGAPNSPSGDAPIFRSFNPVTSPSRTFPRLSDLLANTQTMGEILPSYGRRLNFRLTVRDNRVNGGGTSYDTVSVPVVGTAGPFLVTQPNASGITWRATVPQQVTWDVANTTAAPISAANVDILLSTDGGQTYPYTLLAGTPNDGSEAVTVPATVPSSTTCRLKVKASGNVFFDISNNNFALQTPTAPGFYLTSGCASTAPTFCPGSSATCSVTVGQLLGFTGQVTLSATGLPTGMTASFGANPVAAGASSSVTLTSTTATPSGTYTVSVIGTSGSQTETQNITVTIRNAANIAPTLTAPAANSLRALPTPNFQWTPITVASSYDLQVATDAAFTNVVINQTGLVNNAYTPTTALTQNTTYYWRVRGIADCGTGPWTTTGTFAVGRQFCIPAVFTATDVPQSIPATGSALVLSSISVPQGTNPATQLVAGDVISAIRVRNVAITHPNTGELIISLSGPTGRRITLASVPCNGAANLNASFDDAAAALSCPANTGASYQPANPLAGYLGTTPFGNWTLLVSDVVPGNGGDLTGWGLEICTTRDAVTSQKGAQQLQGVSVYPNPSTGDFYLNVDNGVSGQLSVSVTDALGRVVLTKELRKTAGQLNERLDLSKLSRGMYQLHLSLPGGGTAVEKLMKL